MTSRFSLSLILMVLFASALSADTVPVTNGLVLQIDPSTLTGLQNGAAVSSWSGTNAAGNTITFTQTNADNQPTYQSSVASLGGSAAVYFDSDFLQLAGTLGISGNQGRTVFAVWADPVATGANYQHVMHMGSASTSQAYGLSVARGSNLTVGNHYWGNGFDGKKSTTAGNVAVLYYDGTTDALLLNGYYGGHNTKTDVNTNSGGVTLIGSRLSPYAEGINGSIAELIIYDRQLSTSEIYQVNQYLADKYSLTAGFYKQSNVDWNSSQIKIDFESGLPNTMGEFITENCGIIEQNGNHVYRIMNTVGSLANQLYDTTVNSATGSINGKFDLTFTSANADGVSLTLAGTGIDVTQKMTDPVAESPAIAGSFALGYQIYNKNNVAIYWNGSQIGSIDLATNGSGCSIKDGKTFTTEFSIDYLPDNMGANVTVDLYNTTTGGLYGSWAGYVSSLTAFDNSLLLRGRTGGQTANADFDNIYILYQDATGTLTWIPDASGAFSDATKWDGGVAPTTNSSMKIESGTNTITNNEYVVKDGQTLNVSGGTTTTGGVAAVEPGSTLIFSGGTTGFNELRVGSNSSVAGTAFMLMQNGNVNVQGPLSVGYDTPAQFNMSGGTLVTKDLVTIGDGMNASQMSVTGGTPKFGKGFLVKSGSTLTLNTTTLISANTDASYDSGYITIGNHSNSADNKIVVEKGATFNTNQSIRLARYDGDYGAMEIYGTVNATGSYLIPGFCGNADITVDGGTLNAPQVILGDNTGGHPVSTLTFKNNATGTFSKQFQIGDKTTATATVTITDSTLTVNNNILLGNAGKGTMTVDGASTLSLTGTLNIGAAAGANGSLTIGGTSTVTPSGQTNIGDKGTGALTMQDSANFTTSKAFMISNQAGSSGTALLKDNATLTLTGNHFIIGRNAPGTLTLQDNATVTWTGTGVCGLGEFGSGTLNLEGGTFNVHKLPSSYNAFIVRKSEVNQTGGTMNVGMDGLEIPISIENGTYTLSGGTLNVTGAINMSGDSAFTINEDGTLSATEVAFSLTQDGGTLSPGQNWTGEGQAIGTTTITGDYTAKPDATIRLEIDAAANTADQLVVTGNALFEEGSTLELDYTLEELRPGQSFDLFNVSGATTGLDALLASLSQQDQILWLITGDSDVVTFSVNASAIPEPTAWVLLLTGIFALYAAVPRRVRRSHRA